MAGPLLEIEDLRLSYFTRAGEIPAVLDFSLTLDEGESVGLVGESGCGKSTVALGIMRYMGRNGGIVSGTIRFKGRDMSTLGGEELRRIRGAEIAMVYQEPMAALNPSMIVASQLTEVLEVHEGMGVGEARKRALAALEDVRLPDAERIMTAYPHQLSGGQQQRVVIAMALMSNPSLLLLDEPTTALDVTVAAGIVGLIADLRRKYGTALLYISHNLGLIAEVCDRVCVMYSGEVVEEGTIAEVFAAPRHPYTRGLFDCIPLPAADKNARPLIPIRGQLPLPHERPPGCNFGPRCDHFRAGLCDARDVPMEGNGHRVRCLRWDEIRWDERAREAAAQEATEAGETVLDVAAMQKYYPVRARATSTASPALSGFGDALGILGVLLAQAEALVLKVFDGITRGKLRYIKANETLSFSARQAETVAIVGESGCGKSTFAKVLMGLETATGGAIHFAGTDISKVPVRKRTAAQIGAMQMVFQNPDETLNPSHTVGSQIGRVIRKFGVAQDAGAVRREVERLLDIVKLPRDFAIRRPRQLSGGQKQRVGIARAFAGKPSMVIADEPVSALDVSVQAAVTELLMDIQREHGTTLLFISHDLSVVRYLADRVVVMYLGQIMERGTTDEVFAPPYHPYTEALLSAVPIADPTVKKHQIVLEGTLPSAMDPPTGCPFHTRCPRKLGAVCETEPPPQREDAEGHFIACHIPLEALRAVEPVIDTGAAAGARR